MTVLLMNTCQICEYYEQSYQCYSKHCKLAQAVRCWLNTVEAWVKNTQKKAKSQMKYFVGAQNIIQILGDYNKSCFIN
jgi:hypothetical protein